MKQGRSRPAQADGSRPQLMAPVAWTFQSGATAAPFVLWLGRFALMLSLGLALVWCSAMLLDVVRGQRAIHVALVCILITGAWTMLWWRVWRVWHQPPHAFTLTWTQIHPNNAKVFGWQASKGEPAQVDVLLDAQRWLLCKVQIQSAVSAMSQHTDHRAGDAVHWCWFDLARTPDAHRFRTLLRLNAASLEERADSLIEGRITMASWRMPQADLGVAVKPAGSSFSATLPMPQEALGSSQERV